MTRKSFAIAAVMSGVLVGFLFGFFVAKRVPLGTDASVEWHWKRVNSYLEFVRNPKNLAEIPGTGLIGLTPPYDPTWSLQALDNAGEIYCADILLPTVPMNSRINQHWMKSLDANPDVLYAHGLPESRALHISGTFPLYLKIWFKKSAVADIQVLINELEALARDTDGERSDSTPSK